MKNITKLRALRVNRARPLKLEEVAERTGFSKTQISDVERGVIGASPQLIASLARVYGRSVRYVRRLVEEAARAPRRTSRRAA